MKRKLMTAVLSIVMALSMSVCAFAGQWAGSDSSGWLWINDDGTSPVDQWLWIDDDGDGIEECYYFDTNGLLITNTTAPDGFEVNGDGAWIVDGVVQMQAATAFIENGAVSGITSLPITDTIILTCTNGIGARWCDLLLSPDGTFTGAYESVRNGSSPFTGSFTNIHQIDEYSYSMTLETLNNPENAFGIDGGNEFIFYLPGTPASELTEDFIGWIGIGGTGYGYMQENQKLMSYGLYNVKDGYGFFN